jgi:hypothetical protein
LASSENQAVSPLKNRAFALLTASQDAALIVTLPPGASTAEVTNASGTPGMGLVEDYEIPQ